MEFKVGDILLGVSENYSITGIGSKVKVIGINGNHVRVNVILPSTLGYTGSKEFDIGHNCFQYEEIKEMREITKENFEDFKVRFRALLHRECFKNKIDPDGGIELLQITLRDEGADWALTQYQSALGYNVLNFERFSDIEEFINKGDQDVAKKKTTPTNTPTAPNADAVQQIASLLASLGGASVSDEHIIKLVKEHSQAPVQLEVKSLKGTKVIEGAHQRLKDLVTILGTGNHCYLVGPAGSGKTTLAEQAAEALRLDFYQTGAVLQKYELIGYTDANSHYHETSLYKAYTQGGLFLFDEMDSSSAAALVAFNAILANGSYTFPNESKPQLKHSNFVCVAAANTIGTGPTREYIGRQPLDAATLDRFIQLEIKYDTDLEKRLAEQQFLANGGTDSELLEKWVKNVLKVREKAASSKIHVVISPRASMQGAALLARGLQWETVNELVLLKHLNEDQRKRITQ